MLVLFGFALTICPLSAEEPICRIAAVSNPYITTLSAKELGERSWIEQIAPAGLERSIALANAVKPDAMVVLGSLTWTGSDDDFERVKKFLSRVEAPLYIVPGVKDLLDDAEDWGPGTAIVADGFPWTEGSIRVIVPISDEDPQDGDGCFASDTDAVNNAIAQAKANDVAVSPIVAELGEGNCDSDDCTCIEPLALELAERTGGAMFLSTDPKADLGSAITELVEMVCRLSSDCNGNEIPDACEICTGEGGTAGEQCLPDCNGNGVLDECDLCDDAASGVSGLECSLDCNDNGIPDECDGGCE